MKKKVIGLTIAGIVAVSGVISAASMWGTYKGNDIIRLTVDGVPVKVSDVPAISYNGRTMIPIYLLQQAGIDYTWDQKNKTVDIKPKNSAVDAVETIAVTEQQTDVKLSAKDIAKLMDRVAYVEAYDANGKVYSSGSGFLLSDGWFITNSHVGSKAAGLLVKIGGRVYDTKGWYWFDNPTADIFGTILTTRYSSNGNPVGPKPQQSLEFIDTLPEVGDKVYAIGSPMGLENTLSEGIVSGIRTNTNGITEIQHTADIDHGSSGGVLLNEYGQAIGITSSGYEGSNLEFAIPMKYVVEEFDNLSNN